MGGVCGDKVGSRDARSDTRDSNGSRELIMAGARKAAEHG